VTSAELKVRQLEERAEHLGPYTPGPMLPECQEGTIVLKKDTAIELRDRAQGSRDCSSDAWRMNETQRVHADLEAARETLRAEEQALEGLLEEARRAGALPGWLR
jgi:hypothetical protein